MSQACDSCIGRAWLLARLGGHLEQVRSRIGELLCLGDDELIAAVGGARRGELERELALFDTSAYRRRADRAGLELLCRCEHRYPARLRMLRNAPAVLHVAGGLERFLELAGGDPVALVGARRGTEYGRGVAGSLARALVRAGVPVVSGMALGIDSAAHRGALAGGADTIAVLPSGADRPYPASAQALHRRIIAVGAAVSELPPGTAPRRWSFPARNRIIAGLAAVTVVVEAGDRSGALTTAAVARELGRPVGAVPGRVTSPHAAGPHRLLAGGATIVRGAQDVLDALFGSGVRVVPGAEEGAELGAGLAPELRALLAAIGDGDDTAQALSRAGLTPADGLAALAALELAGQVRREAGGRYSIVLP
jgi:DNA processing protein